MTSSKEEGIEWVSKIVRNLEAEIVKHLPEGEVYITLREQQRKMLSMWQGVLTALLLPTENDKQRLEEDNKTIFRKVTNMDLVISTMREELGQLSTCISNLKELADVEKFGISSEYHRGMYNGLVLAVSVFSGESPIYISNPNATGVEDDKNGKETGETAEHTRPSV